MSDRTEKLLDERLEDYQSPELLLGENGSLKQLTKRALQAERIQHLGYAKHDYQGKVSQDDLNDFYLTYLKVVNLVKSSLILVLSINRMKLSCLKLKRSSNLKRETLEMAQPAKPFVPTLASYS